MRIVILGNSKIAETLIHKLVREAENEITWVSPNVQRLKFVKSQCDIQTIVGGIAYPDKLKQAGVEEADLVISVSERDENNLIACKIASLLSKNRSAKRVARLRSRHYNHYQNDSYFLKKMGIHYIISPEILVSRYIQKIINSPNMTQIDYFAKGKMVLVNTKVGKNAPMFGFKNSKNSRLIR